jgi:hypothetical protein
LFPSRSETKAILSCATPISEKAKRKTVSHNPAEIARASLYVLMIKFIRLFFIGFTSFIFLNVAGAFFRFCRDRYSKSALQFLTPIIRAKNLAPCGST